MKLTTSFLILFALINSAAFAEWPLHQNVTGASGGQAKTFFDSRGRYIPPTPLYPHGFELHQASGSSRSWPFPSQSNPGSHGDARHQGGDAVQKP